MHGLLNIDKPSGMTSRDVVNRVTRLVRRTKVGHAGTLDPLATGVLVVCLGTATRLVDRIQAHRKGYRAGLQLGVRSDTDDSTGTISPGGDATDITAVQMEAALAEFQGEIAQIPPKYSAVHVDGKRAYDLARADQEFELTARTVHVESIRLVQFGTTPGGRVGELGGCDGLAPGESPGGLRNQAAPHDSWGAKTVRACHPEVEIDIVCGSGTYVRSIIRDLGDRLGCGAVMTSLRRTFIGPFRDADALPLDQVSLETLAARLQPLTTVLEDEPRLTATQAECQALLQGRGIAAPADFPWDSPRQIAVLDPAGELFAFAVADATCRVILPQRVFVRKAQE